MFHFLLAPISSVFGLTWHALLVRDDALLGLLARFPIPSLETPTRCYLFFNSTR